MGVIYGFRSRLLAVFSSHDSPKASLSDAGASPSDASRVKARRDELAAQVSELHWDLGGLAYEMAIRDHFRLDVLVRRAAALQERDAELAELERLLDAEARDRPAGDGPAGDGTAGEGPAGDGPSGSGLSLPGPGVAALLVLLMLGFGVLTGNLARGSATAAAVHRGPLTLMVAAAQTADSADPSGAGATASLPGSAPPPSAAATADPLPAASSSANSKSSSSTAAAPSAEAGGKSASGHTDTSPASKSPAKPMPAQTPATSALPPVKHVFLIVLADEPYSATFGPASPAPYLANTLEKQGELLVRYYGVARDELANEIALISGLGPTADTAVNCPTFLDVTPATAGKDGQYAGNGCVYPSSVENVGDQLAAKKLSWRVYAEGMEDAGAGQPTACRHPAFGATDTTAVAGAGDAFATYRDPFSYFDSVIDARACAQEDLGLAALSGDLRDAKRTPALSYIVPSLCHDGHEAPCTPGAPVGLGASEAFLRHVVPEILDSAAYKQGGLLVITTDQAPATGPAADSSSCCAQPSFPGIPGNQPTGSAPAADKLPPPGGGQVGALLLSPYVKPHSFDQEPFNHFSLLRTIEDLFGLGHLGYAALPEVKSFDASVFSRYQAG
jgi:phosphatidylinositol-3-phosphatase